MPTDNLYDLYTSIINNGSCFYYDELKGENLLEHPDEFIRGYFTQGGKETAILVNDIQYITDSLSLERKQHVVSAFLLGVHFYNELKTKTLKDEIDRLTGILENQFKGKNADCKETCERKRFLYLWFITCLYHDMGYLFEEYWEDSSNQNYLECMDILSGDLRRNLQNLPEEARIPEELSGNAETYFKARMEGKIRDKKCIDHGLAGGTLLYKKMKELHCSDDLIHDKITGLLFGKPILENHIAHCAWCIICHNIWCWPLKDPSKAQEYTDLRLGELLYGENERIIKLKDHPLLFLLCLVDTIEPVKRRNWEYLKRMSVKISGSTITIKNHPAPDKLDLNFLLPGCKQTTGNFTVRLSNSINVENVSPLYSTFEVTDDYKNKESRASVYTAALDVIKNARAEDKKDWLISRKTSNAILELLRSWNKVWLSKHPLTFEDIEKLLRDNQEDLKKLEGYTIENINENLENIKKVFGEFKGLLGQTGASKALSLLNPELFMMWDTKIRKALKRIIPGIDNGSTVGNYINFLKGIKKIIERYHIRDKVSPGDHILKKLDEFHYVKFVLNRESEE